VTGFFGGMAGCAMIGQSVINIKSGGRGRLSTLFAGLFLLFLLLVLGDWVRQIPMAALVAVMIMVSIGTFNWSSFSNLRTHPKTSSLVMITTVIVVVTTHDLAIGVFVGVLTSSLFFARRISRFLKIESNLSKDSDKRTYKVYGQVFFASANRFSDSFDFKEVVPKVTIDVSVAHFWDLSAVGALDKVIMKFRREGTAVNLLGMNDASATIIERLAVYDKPNSVELMSKH
jgi:Sulfate permease and related transporters (MFS superfamily)